MRLKSRTKFLPGEFQLLLPEIGMRKPLHGSFNEMVDAFDRVVRGNPALAQKNGWPPDREAQEAWIDEREARRMVAGGWLSFVDFEGNPQKKTSQWTASRSGSGAGAAGTVRTALSIYREMFGAEGRVVDRAEANRRALVCVACPLNDRSRSIFNFFAKAAARELMDLLGMLRDMDVRTNHDGQLGVCQACNCPLAAKTHVEADVLKRHMPADQIERLHPDCWIRPLVA